MTGEEQGGGVGTVGDVKQRERDRGRDLEGELRGVPKGSGSSLDWNSCLTPVASRAVDDASGCVA